MNISFNNKIKEKVQGKQVQNMIAKLLLIYFVSLFFNVRESKAVTMTFDYDFINIYTQSDARETIIKILETEIEVGNPKNYNLHFILGTLYMSVDFKKAIKEFEEVIRLKPDHYLSYINLGYLIESYNNTEEAITYLKKALGYAPNEAVIYNALATVYMRQNKMDEAKDILEEGIKSINSDKSSLYFNQTLVLMKFYHGQREQEKIIRNMKRAIELAPMRI